MIKGIKVNLGGTDYIVPPLSLGALELYQDELETFTGAIDKASTTLTINIGTAALRRNYPDLTREQVADMIDVANMMEVFEAVMDVSGLKRKAEDSGEAEGLSA